MKPQSRTKALKLVEEKKKDFSFYEGIHHTVNILKIQATKKKAA